MCSCPRHVTWVGLSLRPAGTRSAWRTWGTQSGRYARPSVVWLSLPATHCCCQLWIREYHAVHIMADVGTGLLVCMFVWPQAYLRSHFYGQGGPSGPPQLYNSRVAAKANTHAQVGGCIQQGVCMCLLTVRAGPSHETLGWVCRAQVGPPALTSHLHQPYLQMPQKGLPPPADMQLVGHAVQ